MRQGFAASALSLPAPSCRQLAQGLADCPGGPPHHPGSPPHHWQLPIVHSPAPTPSFACSSGVYGDHLTDRGYNAIQLEGLRNAWVRDVRILGADNGVFVANAEFVTLACELPRPPPPTAFWGGWPACWSGAAACQLCTENNGQGSCYLKPSRLPFARPAAITVNTTRSRAGGPKVEANLQGHHALSTSLGQSVLISR